MVCKNKYLWQLWWAVVMLVWIRRMATYGQTTSMLQHHWQEFLLNCTIGNSIKGKKNDTISNNFCHLHHKWAATWQNQQNEFAPSEDSDQPGHPPSLIRVFAVRLMGSLGPKPSSCGQRRLWSDWANAQADLSLHWAHNHIVGFVMSRLRLQCMYQWQEQPEDNQTVSE